MKKKINSKMLSWALYDWANSSFSTTIVAGFFPVFFKSYWSQGFSSVESTAVLGTTIGVSSFLIAVLSPTLGAVSDLKSLKKTLLVFFMGIGILSCFGLSLLSEGQWLPAAILYGLAMMAFTSSCTFYDSLLPFVATDEESDFVSALGYSLGYLGGGVLFLINVLMYLNPTKFGLHDGVQAVKVSFFSVGLWWFVFSLPLMYYVKEPKSKSTSYGLIRLTQQSYKMLKETLIDILKDKNLFYFMIAFWLYIDGVYTVISMAVDYGISLNFEAKDLIAALLITQFVGFPSTFVFGVVAQKWGCKVPIMICIGIYSLTIILATQMSSPFHFYILAAIIGLAQGGVQSLSRSLFAKMIPKEKSGEYFGFMNLIGKFASVLGPFIVAITVTLTGKSNMGLMGLLVLFVIGVYFLQKVKVK